jgi:hypothetical protein
VSRLDSAIRRLEAQRALLGHVAKAVAARPGPVLEVGLGNGRSYDHLRGLLPGREIFAFDRAVAAHPDCIPDARHLLLGDLRDTLPAARARIGAPAVLAHLDIGSGDAAATAALAAAVAPLILPLLSQGALVASDQPLSTPGLRPLELPAGVAPGRYYLYERTADAPLSRGP